MKNDFSPSAFFDLSGFIHKDIFEVETVWEVLGNLEEYVKQNGGENGILIGKGTVIEEGAFIKGPAIIGDNCFIAHGSYIRDNAIIGDNVRILHSAEIKNSVILNNSNVAHFCYVGDSVLGSGVNVGGGTLTANFRLDAANIKIKHDGEVLETGLKKLGAIIGDNSKIGVNCVLNPGTILSKNTQVYPLTSVFGVHLNEETIK